MLQIFPTDLSIFGALFKVLVLRAQEELEAVLRICLGPLWGKRKSDVDFPKSDVGFVKIWSPGSQTSIWSFSKLRRSWACRFDSLRVLCFIFWNPHQKWHIPRGFWILVFRWPSNNETIEVQCSHKSIHPSWHCTTRFEWHWDLFIWLSGRDPYTRSSNQTVVFGYPFTEDVYWFFIQFEN